MPLNLTHFILGICYGLGFCCLSMMALTCSALKTIYASSARLMLHGLATSHYQSTLGLYEMRLSRVWNIYITIHSNISY